MDDTRRRRSSFGAAGIGAPRPPPASPARVLDRVVLVVPLLEPPGTQRSRTVFYPPLDDDVDENLAHMLHAVPLFCFPAGDSHVEHVEVHDEVDGQPRCALHAFVLTDAYGARRFCTCLVARHGRARRALCAVLNYPMWQTARALLLALHRAHGGRLTTAMRPAILDLVFRLPLPPPALPVAVSLGTERLVIARQPLPHVSCDVPLAFLFAHLSAGTVVQAVHALATQTPVVVVAEDAALLTPVCEALRSLVYPLCLEDVYVPLVPAELADIVQSPTSFFLGLPAAAFAASAPMMEEGVLVVDLDADYAHGAPASLTPPILRKAVAMAVHHALCGRDGDLVVHTRPFKRPAEPPAGLFGLSPAEREQDARLRSVFLAHVAFLLAGHRVCYSVRRRTQSTGYNFEQFAPLRANGCPDLQPLFSRLAEGLPFQRYIEQRDTTDSKDTLLSGDQLFLSYADRAEQLRRRCAEQLTERDLLTFMRDCEPLILDDLHHQLATEASAALDLDRVASESCSTLSLNNVSTLSSSSSQVLWPTFFRLVSARSSAPATPVAAAPLDDGVGDDADVHSGAEIGTAASGDFLPSSNMLSEAASSAKLRVVCDEQLIERIQAYLALHEDDRASERFERAPLRWMRAIAYEGINRHADALKDYLRIFGSSVCDETLTAPRLYALFQSLTVPQLLAVSPFAEAALERWSPSQRTRLLNEFRAHLRALQSLHVAKIEQQGLLQMPALFFATTVNLDAFAIASLLERQPSSDLRRSSRGHISTAVYDHRADLAARRTSIVIREGARAMNMRARQSVAAASVSFRKIRAAGGPRMSISSVASLTGAPPAPMPGSGLNVLNIPAESASRSAPSLPHDEMQLRLPTQSAARAIALSVELVRTLLDLLSTSARAHDAPAPPTTVPINRVKNLRKLKDLKRMGGDAPGAPDVQDSTQPADENHVQTTASDTHFFDTHDLAVIKSMPKSLVYFKYVRDTWQLQTVDVDTLTMAERVCFFLNVCTALEIHSVAALGRPVCFFDRATGALPSYMITAAREPLTSDDIKHTIMRLAPRLSSAGALDGELPGRQWTLAISSMLEDAVAHPLLRPADVSAHNEQALLEGAHAMRDRLPFNWHCLLFFAPLECTRERPYVRLYSPDRLEEQLSAATTRYVDDNVVLQLRDTGDHHEAARETVLLPADMRRLCRDAFAGEPRQMMRYLVPLLPSCKLAAVDWDSADVRLIDALDDSNAARQDLARAGRFQLSWRAEDTRG